MATLEDLKPQIDKQKTAMLFLAKNDLANDKEADIKIYVTLNLQGKYMRSFRFVESKNSPTNRSLFYDRWSHLIEDMPEALVESDQWMIVSD